MSDLMILRDSIQLWSSISHASIRSKVFMMLFARSLKVQSSTMPAKYLITKRMKDARNLTARMLRTLVKYLMSMKMPNAKIQH